MILKLTEKQVVVLNWDGSSDSPKPIRRGKSGWTYDLAAEEVEDIRLTCETNSWGCDPSTMTAAKALLCKLEVATA